MLFQRNNCHFTSLFKSNIFLLKRNHIPWIPKNSNNLNNYCSSQIPVWLQACQFFFLAKKNLLLVVFGLVLDFVFNNIHAGVILWIAELHVCLENVTLCLPAWCVWVWWPQKKHSSSPGQHFYEHLFHLQDHKFREKEQDVTHPFVH